MATTQNGIYYPADGTKSADILADMKQMAESVDEVVQEEKENQETIEQKIQELQTEQTAQNKKIEEIDDNQIHITTEKSSNINVQDASGQNGKIKLFGVSRQETREGYNLLNVSNEFEVKGRSNAIAISLKANTNYTVKADNIETNNENPTTLAISFRNASDVSVRDLAFPYSVKKATFQVTGEATKVYIYSADNYNNSQNITTTYTNLMICEGTDDKEYESYGAMPSPEFPSEIENTGGNIDIAVCKKNLFDELWTGTTSTNFITVFAGQKYVYSENGIGQAMNYRFYESKSGSYVTKWIGANSTYIPEKNGFVKLDKTNTTKTKCMLEVGEVVTEYVAHEQQTITFPLQENQKMYKESETEDDGIHHKRKQIVLTGNEQIVKYTKTFPNGYGYRVILNDVKANTEVLSSIYNYEKFSNFYWSSDITNKITTHDTTGGYVLIGSSKATIEEFRQEIAGSVLEYETIEETIEAYTEEQQTAYNQLQNAKTYKLVTNIFTENAEVEMEYVAHTKTYIDNEINSVKEELNTIKELLSTTTTSAMLLDNLQTDLESEVL